MKSNSFRPFFAVYILSLLICGAVRIWLKFNALDLVTGFYSGGGKLPLLYGTLLAAAVALLFLLYLLRRPEADYPILRGSRLLALLALFTGVAILFYQFEMLHLFSFGTKNPGVPLSPVARISCVVLGEIAALSFLIQGARALMHRGVNGILPLMTGVWLMILVVNKFNGYKTLVTISDNIMAVLFYIACAMFLIGHARTLAGLARRDGRNYAIPTGLCASLLGFLLVIPNWVWMAFNETIKIPAPMLGGWESVFVFVASIYAFIFVYHTCDSMKSV